MIEILYRTIECLIDVFKDIYCWLRDIFWPCDLCENSNNNIKEVKAMSNCDNCIFKDVYRDMNASIDLCTLHKDLSLAIAEINFYRQVKCCKSYLSIKHLSSFAKRFPDETKIISEYINTKINNKEL